MPRGGVPQVSERALAMLGPMKGALECMPHLGQAYPAAGRGGRR